MLLDGRAQAQTPQMRDIGIAGFDMYARTQDETTLSADVPVKFLEDGKPASDTIINQPLKLRVAGVVSDVYQGPIASPSGIASSNDQVGAISAFAPERSAPITNKIDSINARVDTAASMAASYTERTSDLFGLSEGDGSKSARQQFLDFIQSAYKARQLISVDGAGGTQENMAITNLVLTQDNKTASISFDLSLQQVRTVETKTVGVEQFYNEPAPQAATQTSATKNKTPQDTEKAGGGDGGSGEQSLLSAVL